MALGKINRKTKFSTSTFCLVVSWVKFRHCALMMDATKNLRNSYLVIRENTIYASMNQRVSWCFSVDER